MIIDSHCHLTYEPMSSSLKRVIEKANVEGVKYLLTISTDNNSFKKILQIIKNYNCVYGSYGIHPHETNKYKGITSQDIIDNIKKDKKIIGVGESGLDFYYNHSEKNCQILSFLEHIQAAKKMNLPLIVHTRSAEDETYRILKEAQNESELKILIHCFTGTKEFAFKLLDLGAYISASGVVTFKKSKKLAETFKHIPTDRLLVETDSPYLAPEPFRGKSNEPSYIVHTVKFLSQLKEKSFEEISNSTSNNFFNLFGNLIEK